MSSHSMPSRRGSQTFQMFNATRHQPVAPKSILHIGDTSLFRCFTLGDTSLFWGLWHCGLHVVPHNRQQLSPTADSPFLDRSDHVEKFTPGQIRPCWVVESWTIQTMLRSQLLDRSEDVGWCNPGQFRPLSHTLPAMFGDS